MQWIRGYGVNAFFWVISRFALATLSATRHLSKIPPSLEIVLSQFLAGLEFFSTKFPGKL